MKSDEQSFADWESEVFGFGYGTGEEHIIGALHSFFAAMKDGRTYSYREMEPLLGPAVCWFVINALCGADILEYGTSPRGGWLTDKGERLRTFMMKCTVDQLCNICFESEAENMCSERFCNCGGPQMERCRNNPFFHGWREEQWLKQRPATP